MKELKRVLLLLVCSVICALSLGAQTSGDTFSPEHIATLQTGRLKRELWLSSLQEQKVYEINLRYARIQHLYGVGSDKVKAQLKNRNKEISDLLDSAQSKRFVEVVSPPVAHKSDKSRMKIPAEQ